MTCFRHGWRRTRLYNIWSNIRQRCFNKGSKHYHNYGGRGISVCPEWQEFVPFRDWALANGYTEKLTIDRIDNNGDYDPGNCRWATMKQQQNNRSNNHRLKFYNSDFTIAEWSRILNIGAGTLRARLRMGWSIQRALTTR